MKRKPWPIVVLAVLHLLSPLGNVLANSVQTQVSVLAYVEALFYPHNISHLLVIVVLPILAGSCIFACRKWSYSAYISLMVVPFFYSLYNTHGQFHLSNVLFILMLYGFNIAIVGYFLLPNIRKIYLNPNIRWWQSNPRFESAFEATLGSDETSPALAGQIKNISVGGFYIELDGILDLKKPILIRFQYEGSTVETLAHPVFHRGTPPRGYGFKVDRAEARKAGLRKIVNSLKAQGAILKSRVPGPEDSFRNWLKFAIKNRAGWFPEARN